MLVTDVVLNCLPIPLSKSSTILPRPMSTNTDLRLRDEIRLDQARSSAPNLVSPHHDFAALAQPTSRVSQR
jgi:hypothetical protein